MRLHLALLSSTCLRVLEIVLPALLSLSTLALCCFDASGTFRAQCSTYLLPQMARTSMGKYDADVRCSRRLRLWRIIHKALQVICHRPPQHKIQQIACDQAAVGSLNLHFPQCFCTCFCGPPQSPSDVHTHPGCMRFSSLFEKSQGSIVSVCLCGPNISLLLKTLLAPISAYLQVRFIRRTN